MKNAWLFKLIFVSLQQKFRQTKANMNKTIQTPPLPLPLKGGECHAVSSPALAAPLPSRQSRGERDWGAKRRWGEAGAGVGSVT